MKQVFLSILIFSACLLVGCHKHNDPGNGPDPTSKLRIKSINSNSFTYDAQGRLLKASYSNSLPAATVYRYTDTTVTATTLHADGSPYPGGAVYTISPNGLTRYERYISDPQTPALHTTFTYNSDGQMVEELAGTEGQAPELGTVYSYSKGNMDSLTIYALKEGEVIGYDRFEYYTDQPNDLSEEVNGISYLGSRSVNLLKKDFRITNNSDTTVFDYTYEFDAQKRPVKRHTLVNGVPFSDDTITFY